MPPTPKRSGRLTAAATVCRIPLESRSRVFPYSRAFLDFRGSRIGTILFASGNLRTAAIAQPRVASQGIFGGTRMQRDQYGARPLGQGCGDALKVKHNHCANEAHAQKIHLKQPQGAEVE